MAQVKVLTPYTPDQQLLLEAGLAERSPVRTISQKSQIAMLGLVHAGLFMPVYEGWSLTNRGRIVAEGLQRQGQVASGLRVHS